MPFWRGSVDILDRLFQKLARGKKGKTSPLEDILSRGETSFSHNSCVIYYSSAHFFTAFRIAYSRVIYLYGRQWLLQYKLPPHLKFTNCEFFFVMLQKHTPEIIIHTFCKYRERLYISGAILPYLNCGSLTHCSPPNV